MIKRLLMSVLICSLTSCAILGSKEALKLENNSGWETISTGHGDYQSYRCDEVSITVNEVVFNSRFHSFGPIIPIIPSGVESEFEDNYLELNIQIIDFVEHSEYGKEKFIFHAFEEKQELSLREIKFREVTSKNINKSSRQWFQYNIKYLFEKKLKDIDSLTVKFNYPFQGCDIPELKMIRVKMQDNEFIIAPGV